MSDFPSLRTLRHCGLTLITLAWSAGATITTNTLDDRDGSISYQTGGPAWNASPGCSSCSLRPDPSQAYDGTWHDNTWMPGDSAISVTIPFTGTGISIYNIIPDNEINADTSLVFTIDGANAGSFTYSPSGGSLFLYKHQVFSNSGLSNSPHTFVMSTDSGSGDEAILFDYAIYTVSVADVSTPPSQTSTPASQPSSSPPQQASSSPSNTASSSPSSPSPTSSPPSSNSTADPSAQPTGTDLSNSNGGSGSTAAPSRTASSTGTDNSGSPSAPSSSSSSELSPQGDNSGSSSTTSSSNSSHAGLIAGALVAIAVLVLGIFLLLLWRRRRHRRLVTSNHMQEIGNGGMRPMSGSDYYLERGRLAAATSRSDLQAPSSAALTETDSSCRDMEFSHQQPMHPDHNSPGLGAFEMRMVGGHPFTEHSTDATTFTDESHTSSPIFPSEDVHAAAVAAKGQAEDERNRERERVDWRTSASDGLGGRWSVAPTLGSSNQPPHSLSGSDGKAPPPSPAQTRLLPPLPPVLAASHTTSVIASPPASADVDEMREQMGSLLAEVNHLRAQQAAQEMELRTLRVGEALPQYQPPAHDRNSLEGDVDFGI